MYITDVLYLIEVILLALAYIDNRLNSNDKKEIASSA